ncbi:Tetraspanin-18 [Mactra antiquata]
MFGNSMFGHHMHMAAHNTSNTGFGSGGFGSTGHHSSSPFDSTKKGSSSTFASGSAHLDPHGVMHQGYDHQGHYHHGILRQNSLLGEMTQSKKERANGVRPWAFSSISYPTGQHGDGSVLGMGSAYHKPLEETHSKPKLQRQQSFSVGEGLEYKRAPSFSSDPERMRSKTISTSSMPARPLFKRSVSISDDLTEPQNMDIAKPFLKRQQSLDIEKARKKFQNNRRSSLIQKFGGKFRRSSRAKSPSAPDSETSSLHFPSYRSRANSNESRKSSKGSLKSCKEEKVDSEDHVKPREKKSDTEDQHAKLILGLMNPDTDDNVFESQPIPVDITDNRPEEALEASTLPARTPSPIQSPTLVSKRVQHLVVPEPELSSMKSNRSDHSPQSVRSQISNHSNQSSRRSKSPIQPRIVSITMQQKHLDPANENVEESDTSDTYYDCDNQQGQKPSAIHMKNVPSPMLRNKKRSAKRSRDRHSSSTCTDGEDTTSTCDTPPRSYFRDMKPKYQPDHFSQLENERHQGGGDDIYEAETLKIRGMNQLRSRKPFYAQQIYGDDLTGRRKSSNSELEVPEYAPALKAELVYPKDNQNHETNTADSSESGYATSNLPPVSPKNYDHVKVSQFVNSLPYYPDMEEQRSDCSEDKIVMNGSGSDNESLTEDKIDYNGSCNDLGNIVCASGSDSESESIKTGQSSSKLEVMKLLDRSPTEVHQRVINSMNEKKLDKPSTVEEEPKFNPAASAKLRKESSASETEVMKLLKHEEKTAGVIDEPEKQKHVEVDTVVVRKEYSEDPIETQLLKSPSNNPPSFAASVIERFSFARQYPAYQSKSTKCIDALLHILNVVLFLSSAGVVAFGIWLIMKEFNINDITVILGNNLLQVIVYVAISGAGVTMLAAFCLCCGIRQDKVGLGFYASILVAVVIAFATAAVLSTIFADKLKGVEFRFNFKDRLLTKYGLEEQDMENRFFTDAWNDMQEEFSCCGGEGNENDTDSWALYRFSEWFRKHEIRGMVFVPESCCQKNTNIRVCQGGDHLFLGPPRYPPPRNKYYPDPNPNLNTNGCYAYLSKYLSKLSMYIAICCGSLAGLYFLTVMLTWVFCFKKQDFNESFYDDSYYDIEDDVFNSEDGHGLLSQDPDVHHRLEETKLLDSPDMKSRNHSVITPACNGDVKNRNDLNVNRPCIDDHIGNNDGDVNSPRHVYKTTENSDSSESDSDSESTSSSARSQEVIERRNAWMYSGCTAGHLLSIAIEEEDSNLEDSDCEMPENSAHV